MAQDRATFEALLRAKEFLTRNQRTPSAEEMRVLYEAMNAASFTGMSQNGPFIQEQDLDAVWCEAPTGVIDLVLLPDGTWGLPPAIESASEI